MNDYDWPDEATMRMAQRREKLRFKWAEKKKADGQQPPANEEDPSIPLDE
ncbi:MAG: hypothetical protein HC898_08355 [Phycisphaerales bacterium]|nr:hypothetical protein [Phycisphaerales bacterium]